MKIFKSLCIIMSFSVGLAAIDSNEDFNNDLNICEVKPAEKKDLDVDTKGYYNLTIKPSFDVLGEHINGWGKYCGEWVDYISIREKAPEVDTKDYYSLTIKPSLDVLGEHVNGWAEYCGVLPAKKASEVVNAVLAPVAETVEVEKASEVISEVLTPVVKTVEAEKASEAINEVLAPVVEDETDAYKSISEFRETAIEALNNFFNQILNNEFTDRLDGVQIEIVDELLDVRLNISNESRVNIYQLIDKSRESIIQELNLIFDKAQNDFKSNLTKFSDQLRGVQVDIVDETLDIRLNLSNEDRVEIKESSFFKKMNEFVVKIKSDFKKNLRESVNQSRGIKDDTLKPADELQKGANVNTEGFMNDIFDYVKDNPRMTSVVATATVATVGAISFYLYNQYDDIDMDIENN